MFPADEAVSEQIGPLTCTCNANIVHQISFAEGLLLPRSTNPGEGRTASSILSLRIHPTQPSPNPCQAFGGRDVTWRHVGGKLMAWNNVAEAPLHLVPAPFKGPLRSESRNYCNGLGILLSIKVRPCTLLRTQRITLAGVCHVGIEGSRADVLESSVRERTVLPRPVFVHPTGGNTADDHEARIQCPPRASPQMGSKDRRAHDCNHLPSSGRADLGEVATRSTWQLGRPSSAVLRAAAPGRTAGCPSIPRHRELF